MEKIIVTTAGNPRECCKSGACWIPSRIKSLLLEFDSYRALNDLIAKKS